MAQGDAERPSGGRAGGTAGGLRLGGSMRWRPMESEARADFGFPLTGSRQLGRV